MFYFSFCLFPWLTLTSKNGFSSPASKSDVGRQTQSLNEKASWVAKALPIFCGCGMPQGGPFGPLKKRCSLLIWISSRVKGKRGFTWSETLRSKRVSCGPCCFCCSYDNLRTFAFYSHPESGYFPDFRDVLDFRDHFSLLSFNFFWYFLITPGLKKTFVSSCLKGGGEYCNIWADGFSGKCCCQLFSLFSCERHE